MEYINFEHNETAAELVRAAYDTPPLAFVHSYGCQQNVNDGERIRGVLVDIGYGLCDKPGCRPHPLQHLRRAGARRAARVRQCGCTEGPEGKSAA